MLVAAILHHVLQVGHVQEPCDEHLRALPPLGEGFFQLTAGPLVILPPSVTALVVPLKPSAGGAPRPYDAAPAPRGRRLQLLRRQQHGPLQEVLWDFLPAQGAALAVPGRTFHAQEAEDVAAGQADRVDAALQADGTLQGAARAGLWIRGAGFT